MRHALLFFCGLSLTSLSQATDQPPARIMVNQSGQGVALTSTPRTGATNGPRFVATYEDKSVWYFGEKFSAEKQPEAFYCWIDEIENPQCKRVWVDMTEPKPKKKP